MEIKTYKNQEIVIRGERIGLGESSLIKIPVDRLATGTLIEIPVYVFNGETPGPTVLLQGGLHGDEINGVELIRRMLIDKRYKITKGCVIVVPLLNVFGFLNLARDMHGKDVNRSFPGSKKGSLASSMANFISKELIPLIDFAIDYHTGGAQRNNYPQIRYTPIDARAASLAKLFAAPFVFPSRLISKSFRNECFKQGVPVIVYEAGESLRLDEFAIEKGIEGTLRILKHFEMIDEQVHLPSLEQPVYIAKRRWIRAKAAGLFSASVYNGAAVTKGMVLGTIVDTYGETKFSVKAPSDGYIIALNFFPVINKGDALFHFGMSEGQEE